jgi:ABC-type multidrug transport system fused ATPase/permease subunit
VISKFLNRRLWHEVPSAMRKALYVRLAFVPILVVIELVLLFLLSKLLPASNSDSNQVSSFLVIATIALLFIRTLVSWIWAVRLIELTSRIDQALGRKLLSSYLTASQETMDRFSSGTAIRSLDSAVTQVVYGTLFNLFLIIHDLLLATSILSLITFMSPQFGLTMILVLGASFLLYVKNISAKQRNLAVALERTILSFVGRLFFISHNSRSIRAQGLEDSFVESYSQERTKMINLNAALEKIYVGGRFFVEITIYLAVCFFVLVSQLFTNSLSAIFLLVVGIRIIPSINRALSSFTKLKSTDESAHALERNLQILKEGARIPSSISHQSAATTDLALVVSVKEVSYSYSATGRPLFQDVSFDVGRGEILVIMGEIGKGKSTLIDIVLGLREPSTGTAKVFGLKSSELTSGHRGKIAFIPQEVPVIAGTWRENLLFGAELEVSDREMHSVLKDVNLSKFCNDLDDLIGDSFRNLSGGEKQMLALARAIVRNPVVLILDEVTSNLDTDSELHYLELLNKFMANRSAIFVTHRPAPLQYATKVFEL